MRLIIISGLSFCFVACNESNHKNADVARHDTIVVRDTMQSQSAVTDTGRNAISTAVTMERLIVAGKQIGLTSMNENANAVAEKLGPANDGDAAMGKSIGIWYAKNDRSHYTKIFFTTNFGDSDEAKRVNHIRINSPYFSTAEHLSVGSSLHDIKQYYPAIKINGTYSSDDKRSKITVYDDQEKGIAFETDLENNCVAISVHRPGEKAFQTYLAFFNDYMPAGN